MAYKVTFSVPERELMHSNIEFKVHADGKLFGTLLISKGALVWRPSNKQKSFKTDWKRLASLLEKSVALDYQS